jgi:hypothetical protein
LLHGSLARAAPDTPGTMQLTDEPHLSCGETGLPAALRVELGRDRLEMIWTETSPVTAAVIERDGARDFIHERLPDETVDAVRPAVDPDDAVTSTPAALPLPAPGWSNDHACTDLGRHKGE